MNRTRIDHAIEDSVSRQRRRDTRPASRPTLRPVTENDDIDGSVRQREDWFDRTFEHVRGFLDDMFR